MAARPIFVPDFSGYPFVKTIDVEFVWYPGFSKSQAQRSIASLHEAAEKLGYSLVLEISSKSPSKLGISLSAFNLQIRFPNCPQMSVECAFQGSKVFESGGPYTDLYNRTSREAKADGRIRSSGDVISFRLAKEEFPINPKTAFYDWLYLRALSQNRDFADQLSTYNGFSDIVFNPSKSINCQARSAALYAALSKIVDMGKVVSNKEFYLDIISNNIAIGEKNINSYENQLSLPFDF